MHIFTLKQDTVGSNESFIRMEKTPFNGVNGDMSNLQENYFL